MPDTLNLLKNKARRLYTKLAVQGVYIPPEHKLHLLAFTLGYKCWDRLQNAFERRPLPYTHYQPDAERLSLRAGISIDMARQLLDEIRWPSEYVPIFNTFPLTNEGCVRVPVIIISSHLFGYSRHRKPHCLQERIAVFDAEFRSSRDLVLYSGEQLNGYDKLILLNIFFQHPADCPIGRPFTFSQKEMEVEGGRKFSAVSLEASVRRLRDCRISIPKLNFFGPFVSDYRRVKINGKFCFRMTLNPQLARLYYDPLYGCFMDDGKLFHYSPSRKNDQNRDLEQKDKFDFGNDSDVAAIFAIIAQEASEGKVSFKLIEDVRFDEHSDEVAIKFPKWILTAQRHFMDLYGAEFGNQIFFEALGRFNRPFFQGGKLAE